jgi:hypothetical protein
MTQEEKLKHFQLLKQQQNHNTVLNKESGFEQLFHHLATILNPVSLSKYFSARFSELFARETTGMSLKQLVKVCDRFRNTIAEVQAGLQTPTLNELVDDYITNAIYSHNPQLTTLEETVSVIE